LGRLREERETCDYGSVDIYPDLIDIYRTLCRATEYILFKYTNLNEFNRNEIIQSKFSEHSRIKLETNSKEIACLPAKFSWPSVFMGSTSMDSTNHGWKIFVKSIVPKKKEAASVLSAQPSRQYSLNKVV
jgi:hypothetical protein